MAATRRLVKELEDIRKNGVPGIRNLQVDEQNILNWEFLILPTECPFKSGAFRVFMTFNENYPFKPPNVIFKTQIYHPNVDEKGSVCLNIINSEHWKPATTIRMVLLDLIKLVNNPEPEHPLRAEIAEQYVQNRSKFIKTAESFTKKHAEKRPS